MLLVTQHSHFKFNLCSIVGNRKKILGSTPSTCLSNCYPSIFQRTSLYFPQVAYYAVCTKLGSDWRITTSLSTVALSWLINQIPLQRNITISRWAVVPSFALSAGILYVTCVSIQLVDCHSKFNTCNLVRHRNQLPQRGRHFLPNCQTG